MNRNPRQLSPNQLTKQAVRDIPAGHILFIPRRHGEPHLYQMSEAQRIAASHGRYGGPRPRKVDFTKIIEDAQK
jgi:hypothetical protein